VMRGQPWRQGPNYRPRRPHNAGGPKVKEPFAAGKRNFSTRP